MAMATAQATARAAATASATPQAQAVTTDKGFMAMASVWLC